MGASMAISRRALPVIVIGSHCIRGSFESFILEVHLVRIRRCHLADARMLLRFGPLPLPPSSSEAFLEYFGASSPLPRCARAFRRPRVERVPGADCSDDGGREGKEREDENKAGGPG